MGAGIGVNYGTRATTLPSPADVAQFLARDTIIERVRLLDADPVVLGALANTGLAVDVAVPNADVPRLTSMASARRWVREKVAPHHARGTNISRVVVGSEVSTEANRTLLLSLVPAMHNLHTALRTLSSSIKVSTTHSLGVLAAGASPPSAARFRDDDVVMKPLLRFLRATAAPFMLNAYPFYGLTDDTLDLALFRANAGVVDKGSGGGDGLRYTNMLDAQLDAVHTAMKRLGGGFSDDVDIVVAATGWPSAGEDWELGVGPDMARDYNSKAIRHLGSGVGTPLMPNRTFEVSIFSLFDENLKPGPVSERNFGIFRGDMTPVYDVGILVAPETVEPVSAKATPPPRQWCVPKPAADQLMLQDNIDFACAQDGVDCAAIRPGGVCYEPDTTQGHAAYAMNLYFHSKGQHPFDCDFGDTGIVTTADPSNILCLN